MTNSKMANDFLSQLHNSCGNFGSIIIRKATSGINSGFIGAFEFDQEVTLKDTLQYYYTINPRDEFNGKSQGSKKDIKYLTSFFADIDCGAVGHKKLSQYETSEDALSVINDFPLKPTFTIFTGHGYQVLFFLKVPLVPGEDISLEEYEGINRRLQMKLGADTTPDASRLLRLPGSLNLKEEPRFVDIVDQNPECVYDIDDFKKIVASVVHNDAIKKSDQNLRRVYYDKRKIPRRSSSIIKTLSDPKNLDNDDHSVLVHTAVYQLYSKGFSANQIYSSMTEEGTAMKDYLLSKRKTEEGIKEYINLSIAKAETDLRNEKEALERKTDDVLKNVNLLGADTNSYLYFWKNGAMYPVKLSAFSRDSLQLLSGYRASPEEFEKLKETIISSAYEKDHIDINDKLLEGVWQIDGEFLIISRNKVLKVSSDGVSEVTTPVYAHKVIEFSTATNWLDTDHFMKVYGTLSLKTIYDKIHHYTTQFSWKYKEAADYAAALVMLSVVQQAMSWRPWVYLIGASNTGKTTFIQNFFDKLFPGLLAHMGKTTAHAIAQKVGNSTRILMLDEFERYSKIQQILELAKDCNRGPGEKTSGTPGPNALVYKLNQMFWFASILSSLEGESQENRTIFLELVRHENGSNPPSFANNEDMKKLGTEIVAVMIQYWDAIEKRSQEIPGRYDHLDSRMHESLSYSIAVLELADEEDDSGSSFMRIPPQFVYKQVEREEVTILNDILDSTITSTSYTCSGYSRREKIRIFDAIDGYDAYRNELSNIGIGVTETNGQKYVALHCKTIERYVLKDMQEYAYINIVEPLKRLPGAIPNHPVKINGKTQRCLLIPYEVVVSESEEKEPVSVE